MTLDVFSLRILYTSQCKLKWKVKKCKFCFRILNGIPSGQIDEENFKLLKTIQISLWDMSTTEPSLKVPNVNCIY